MPSIQSKLIKLMFFSTQKKNIGRNRSVAEQRTEMDAYAKNAEISKCVSIDRNNIAGVPCETYTPENAPKDKFFLYVHGGAYNAGSFICYGPFVAHFAEKCNVKAILVGYRLAPEAPFPAGLEDVVSVYKSLIESGVPAQNILIGGDSAGGGLSIAAMLSFKEQGLPLPNACVALSPWVDLTNTSETHQTRVKLDCMLIKRELDEAAVMYANGVDLRHPLISPLFADLSGLPPLFIQVGTDEILLDDSLKLAEKAKKAGLNVNIKVWKGMFHIWHMMEKFMPEAKQAMNELCAFIRLQLSLSSILTED